MHPELLTAISVPFVVAAVWLFVRRLRKTHSEPKELSR
jgi:uncharacterized membrane-anchored protein